MVSNGGSMYVCVNVCQCVNVSMCQCLSMCQCVNVSMCQCVNQCVNVSMCQCVWESNIKVTLGAGIKRSSLLVGRNHSVVVRSLLFGTAVNPHLQSLSQADAKRS